jgi:hypothetical protein
MDSTTKFTSHVTSCIFLCEENHIFLLCIQIFVSLQQQLESNLNCSTLDKSFTVSFRPFCNLVTNLIRWLIDPPEATFTCFYIALNSSRNLTRTDDLLAGILQFALLLFSVSRIQNFTPQYTSRKSLIFLLLPCKFAFNDFWTKINVVYILFSGSRLFLQSNLRLKFEMETSTSIKCLKFFVQNLIMKEVWN